MNAEYEGETVSRERYGDLSAKTGIIPNQLLRPPLGMLHHFSLIDRFWILWWLGGSFYQIMTLSGYEARVWSLEGHVVPEVKINGRWKCGIQTYECII